MTAVIIIVSAIYAGIMFLIARWGDRTNNPLSQKITHHPIIYAFALGIYCSSWTYFGAVGTASTDGWQFLPILLGPILLMLFGYPILAKLVQVSKKQNLTSIADFISARYGKRQQTALIVTVIATLAIIPYIALQLKAINASFSALTLVNDSVTGIEYTSAFLAALLIALFAILYGARKADVTEYRSGLIFAIAFESLFKLLGLVVSAWIALTLFDQIEIADLPAMPESIWTTDRFFSLDFIVQTFMAGAAILCLPRQFHVMVVDNSDSKNLQTARWLFPLYLVLTAAAIIPIALAGHYFLLDTGVNKDIFTMELPMYVNSHWATIFVFLGGISAASAMIIVATLTLSTMITNDVFMPLLLKRDSHQILDQGMYKFKVVPLRQFTIGAILLLSYAYYLSWANQTSLHSIGLIAFSLVIQLLPAIIGGLYWRKGHANGVYAGLTLGFLSWLMFLLMPLASASDVSQHSGIISQGVIISLIVNCLAYYAFSLMAKERLIDKIQAAAFVHPNVKVPIAKQRLVHTSASVKDLTDLLMTFLGNGRCEQLLLEYEQDQEELAIKEGSKVVKLKDTEELTHHFVEYCERMLAGVLGASSAQSLVNIVLSGKQLDVEDVVNFFDDTTMALKTNQAILFSSLENLSQGISVIDKDLNLVAWNKQYLELFDYPKSMVKVGLPVKNLIQFNALRGECGHGEIDELVNKRLSHLQSSQTHSFIRRRSDGRVIEMVGNPLPNGGFVTSFNDITSFIETEQALKDANINLEHKVKRRVDQISEISQELRLAKQEAEQANASKTRFLALASHDVLQPLNAARLYVSSLSEDSLTESQHQTLDKVDQSLYAMEDLLATLLEISKLEQGALVPTFTHFKLSSVLRSLCDEISAQCQDKGIHFIEHWHDVVVYCDATYLRRILQNFLSNAVKYTNEGKVLIGIRHEKKGTIRIEVWDTGEGISESDHQHVFQDFYRTHTGSIKGLGLGLGVVERMSEQLKCPIKLSSRFGKGSCFGVSIQLGDSNLVAETSKFAQHESSQFNHLNVICVDDEIQNLDAMKSLLEKWSCHCLCFSSVEALSEYLQLSECVCPDALLIDYQLVPSTTSGLELIQQVRSHWNLDIPAALITAVKEESLKETCKQLDVRYMPKPLKPAALKSWLKSLVQKQ
ncbi:PAS domain-containing hybrid sensor histidine kinase/response regulator [uncultured Psychrosphaera sp.]|uniref:PAS domain-containing hybrid sensor histidine kinase/response regulator n=1 Tax=uncultured Psychrosphaera sp. TaxID=1403522 RepID=UPI002603ACF4|nr:PAS domain-containing hybrid sensor histidine kinase/response regulator [uncultured Psychrosphaera sp.]